MNAALHGTAALSTVVFLLAATTFACSSDFESSGASNGTAGSGAASGGGPTGDAGESGGGLVSGGGSGGSGSGSGGTTTGGASAGGASAGGSNSGVGGEGGEEPEPCPERGSPMVRLPAEAGGFCVDAHETTRGEYAEFLANIDELEHALPDDCVVSNLSYEPSEGQNDTDMDLPVVGVDYCDAYAYCTWAGKRMCGGIGGGATDYDAFNNAMDSEWQAACSRGGTRVFPYGNNYDPSLCNGANYSADQPGKIAVETSPCEGGYEGIFDMSGNVWEWENACQEMENVGVVCRLRGGEFSNPEGFLRCDYGGFSALRDFATNSIGIRCCAP